MKRALVVGAGVAGSATAWWLANTGWDVVLADAKEQPNEGGYLLHLDETAVELLRRMGLAGAVRAVSGPSPDVEIRWSKDRTSQIAAGPVETWLTRRQNLLGVLHDHLPTVVRRRFGSALVSLETRLDGVVAQFSDDSREPFDLVVGADGIHSTVRRLIHGPDENFVYRNGISHVWIELDEQLPNGRRAVIAGAGSMLTTLFPYHDTGTTVVCAAMPLPGPAPAPEVLAERVGTSIRSLGPDMARIADAAFQARPALTRFAQVRLPGWSTSRTVLVGDSAHCVDPLSGAGAHAALLAAHSLAHCLEAETNLAAALAMFKDTVHPFAAAQQQLTARLVEYVAETGGRRRLSMLVDGARELGRLLPAALSATGRRALSGVPVRSGDKRFSAA
ncbi:NAD(P)/FAD-dependent oxidoreductase [Lentzea sp. CC55]|uniref:FAD-dependent oxidoreductase n=1 Tax=Lentzea sp. CC55 TaxID=2884909 RepID=UPI001F363768|nr:FAD-dependent oxidoreductase [Lentzea sp. CC55]MCG8927369.1 FAD-dependent oxidoreductase [Lentzea sp. CC55]